MKKNILFVIIISLFLAGCKSKPGDAQILGLLIDKHDSSEIGNFTEIINYKKENGFLKNENVYIVDVSYDLNFTTSYDDFSKQIEAEYEDGVKGLKRRGSMEKLGIQIQIAKKYEAIIAEYKKLKNGKNIAIKTKLNLINTENGWIIDSV